MEYSLLADLLFPNVTKTPEDIEAQYPPRALPEGAKVTRFAPSPTGFIHFGGLFPTMVSERLAHQSGGVFYLRIEDTDAMREVPGAAEALIDTLSRYGVSFDEGAITDGDRGDYGPYRQRQRAEIYHVFAKDLVKKGLAYPCFTTEEEYEKLQAVNKKEELKQKDWTGAEEKRRVEQAGWRQFTIDSVKASLAAGQPFVLRILADGAAGKTVAVTDLIKGKLELPENEEDFVLLKSDGIPTYHFAHAVDDHLMGTTHVIRGEEWLPSLPKHLQLFRYLGFRPPKYLHIAQIMRLDENGNKKKLSKRDMGANLGDYEKMGYSSLAVSEYVMTLLNSNFEEWRTANPGKSYRDFPFSIKKMSSAGCLFDFDKLNDVSKNVLAGMTTEEIYAATLAWAKKFSPAFAARLSGDPAYAKRFFSIGRGGKKPRKDFATFAEAEKFFSFFYDESFTPEDKIPDSFDTESVKKCLRDFLESYDPQSDSTAWFENVKAIADKNGYCPDMKAYKADPSRYQGNVGDVSGFLRIAVTGRSNSPDLYTVMQILGEERVKARITSLLSSL